MLFSHLLVSGHSMEPTLYKGDSIFASSIPYLFRNPQKFDLVVLTHPTSGVLLIKRIVKENQFTYFVCGDNPKDSLDSRVFGWVKKKDIMAKVLFIHTKK